MRLEIIYEKCKKFSEKTKLETILTSWTIQCTINRVLNLKRRSKLIFRLCYVSENFSGGETIKKGIAQW